MPGAPSGLLGRLPAERPVLVTGLLALGLAAFSMLGVRDGAGAGNVDLTIRVVLSVLGIVGAPLALAAAMPKHKAGRIFFLLLTVLVGGGLGAFSFGVFGQPPVILSPASAGVAVGFFLFLITLSPIIRNALRLGVLAPFAALLGVAGGIGFLDVQDVVAIPFNAAAIAVGLAGGLCVGIGIGADFAHYFAKGVAPRAAAAAAGHAALAPAAFYVLVAAAYALTVTLQTNFGAVDWGILTGFGAVALLGVVTTLVGVTASLSLLPSREQIAVDENRRRQTFAQNWLPMRRLLPATTAIAALAIAGVLGVIAAFEVGVAMAFDLALFIGLVLIASGLAFVSLRTSFLIAAILLMSTTFAGYVYEILGLTPPALIEKFAALTVAAIALAQLTVSWRNAGDIWRNARDIAQNAMSDGLRRYIIALGAGAASLAAAAYACGWEDGLAVAGYYATVCGFGVVLAPVMMVALSARTQQY